MNRHIAPSDLPAMTPAEVARLYSVDPTTVTRWAKTGKIPSFHTPGGHRRYPRAEVLAQFAQNRLRA